MIGIEVICEQCLGCGRCAITCFRQAITLPDGHPSINPLRCNGCGLCIESCSQGALVFDMEEEPVSQVSLIDTVAEFKQSTDEVIEEIERIERR